MELRMLRYFVAVAEELHFGRAAARLHMSQPPLSRAIRRLETDLGCELLRRSPAGVALTPAGTTLYGEARALLARVERARARVTAAAGTDTITVGTLADSAEQVGIRIAAAYRQRHPGVRVRIREADLTDPTAGLRAGLVDVALTWTPFDDTGITTRMLRTEPVGVVLRADDPLADRRNLHLGDLVDRRWVQLPEGTDPVWRAFWIRGTGSPDGPMARTVHECLQAVLWNGGVGVSPLGHALPEGLTVVPVVDMPPSHLVVAWNSGTLTPLIRSFAELAAVAYRPAGRRADRRRVVGVR